MSVTPNDILKDMCLQAGHSKIQDYAIMGLESKLLNLRPRMFDMTRHQINHITPHSHRFDFFCIVLKGAVRNIVWVEDKGGDPYCRARIKTTSEFGKYDTEYEKEVRRWSPKSYSYQAGNSYAMRYTDIHSIVFEKDTQVLFLEGEEATDESYVLLPVVNGNEVVNTLKKEQWMFRCEQSV